jgi:uncharacterized membrane protein YgdD (TMEM256/DUF423 family)
MDISKLVRAVAVLSGLTGAGGIILAAVGAHLVSGAELHNAAHLMLIHAAAAAGLCGTALALPRRGRWFASAACLLLSGSLVFASSMALGALLESKLFSMAAPAGAVLLIGGWLLAATAAAIAWPPQEAGRDQKFEN